MIRREPDAEGDDANALVAFPSNGDGAECDDEVLIERLAEWLADVALNAGGDDLGG